MDSAPGQPSARREGPGRRVREPRARTRPIGVDEEVSLRREGLSAANAAPPRAWRRGLRDSESGVAQGVRVRARARAAPPGQAG